MPLPHIMLPLAISFFTFQQIAYLIDCYKSPKYTTHLSASGFLDYCLFVTFFPQLIAGPIVHHKEMMPQFRRLNTESTQTNKDIFYQSIAKGLFIFSLGLFKKVLIADSFAKWANAGFSAVENGAVLNFFESWATSLSYTFQLYFDFSGYCDMALGLGLLFGVVLPLNFNSPYKARNIADFWRRWHITLGRFLKEYVYIPLGGNRNEKYKNALHYVLINKILTLRNLFIVAFLSGIWHGSGWGFIIWGCLHGVAMVVHRIYQDLILNMQCTKSYVFSKSLPKNDENLHKTNPKTNLGIDSRIYINKTESSADSNVNTDSILYDCEKTQPRKQCNIISSDEILNAKKQPFRQKLLTLLYWFLTFNFVNLSWIFFRAENISGAFNLIKGMFSGAIVLPSFLESRLGFLKEYGVGFGKWANSIDESSFVVIGALFVVFVLVIACKNSFEYLQRFRPNLFTLFAILFALFGSLIVLSIHNSSEFIYFNF